jgi:hypothetical protein
LRDEGGGREGERERGRWRSRRRRHNHAAARLARDARASLPRGWGQLTVRSSTWEQAHHYHYQHSVGPSVRAVTAVLLYSSEEPSSSSHYNTVSPSRLPFVPLLLCHRRFISSTRPTFPPRRRFVHPTCQANERGK